MAGFEDQNNLVGNGHAITIGTLDFDSNYCNIKEVSEFFTTNIYRYNFYFSTFNAAIVLLKFNVNLSNCIACIGSIIEGF